MPNKFLSRTFLLLTALASACGGDNYSADDYDDLRDDSNASTGAQAQDAGKDGAASWDASHGDAGSASSGPPGSDAGTARDASPWAEAGPSDAGSHNDAAPVSWPRADAGPSPDAGGAQACSALTYESFGKQFLSNYCVSCHGAVSPKANIRLDSLAGLVANKAVVRSAVVGSIMPQGNKQPTSAERERLGQWIDCGPK